MSAAASHTVSLRLRETVLELGGRCRIMGILNVTPDSFSDGGAFRDAGQAAARALRMADEGADIIDVGGESTRPGASPVSEQEEAARVVPVIREIRRRSGVPISVDTRNASVASAALAEGADIINDVSALRHDPGMAEVAAEHGAPVVLMHMQGEPATMQLRPAYDDVVSDVLGFFRARLSYCADNGITQVIVDPGIGFGKTLEHNLALLRALPAFASLQVPLLVGTSRKSFLGIVTGLPVEQRLPGSLASAVLAALKGAHLLRVHDVRETRAALDTVFAIEQGEVAAHAV